MLTELDLHDIEVIISALGYSKKNIMESQDHASYEQKQAFLREVEEVTVKIRFLRDKLKQAEA